MEILDRFLEYVQIDTQSDENSGEAPSTQKQKNLGRLLASQLKDMGAVNVYFDEQFGYVYAIIPGSKGREGDAMMGFLAHMDTAPESSGTDVKPQVHQNYDGEDIVLNKDKGIILSTKAYPEIKAYVGKTIITSDGTTLLGADDKAGVAEIMTMAQTLLSDTTISHRPISICFTPDEEIGCGTDHIDLDRMMAEYAYTVDGGAIGEIEYENFNAASLVVKVKGVTVHPGEAKDKMLNSMRVAMEYERLLPTYERPENTEDYQGFFHLSDMKGCVEETTLEYIIRDHDRALFENRKKMAEAAAKQLNEKYGEGCVEVILKDSYYNMKEKVEPNHMFLIDQAKEEMQKLGIVPKIQPIRGGTDGARLSYMGLPCPNLCTGGHNFHGRYEYVCLESMEQIAKLLVAIAGR